MVPRKVPGCCTVCQTVGELEGEPGARPGNKGMINMSELRETYLIDDLDGTTSKEAPVTTVEFGIGKDRYEIDLSDANAEKLRTALAEFIGKARKISGSRRGGLYSVPGGKSSARPVTADREQNQAIREWASRQGFTVSERGRIPAKVLEAYNRRPTTPPPAAEVPEQRKPDAATRKIVSALATPKASAPKTPPATRKARGNGKVVPPVAAPAGKVTRLNKITGVQIAAVCEHIGDLVADHGESWVELRGNRDDIAAQITAAQAGMPGGDATQRAAKASLTRVVKELRDLKSRKVEVTEAA